MPVWLLTPLSKWAIITGLLVASHGFVAYKVWDHITDQYKLEAAAMTTKIVTVENTILKKDQKAIEAAVKAERENNAIAHDIELGWKDYENKQKLKDALSNCPAFELDADGLRLWNAENVGRGNQQGNN